jgi:hypothetical protein
MLGRARQSSSATGYGPDKNIPSVIVDPRHAELVAKSRPVVGTGTRGRRGGRRPRRARRVTTVQPRSEDVAGLGNLKGDEVGAEGLMSSPAVARGSLDLDLCSGRPTGVRREATRRVGECWDGRCDRGPRGRRTAASIRPPRTSVLRWTRWALTIAPMCAWPGRRQQRSPSR